MAVATWNRNESKLKYVYTIYQIEQLILQFIVNAPKKYQNMLGAVIMKECDQALYNARVAQSLFPVLDPEMLLQRRYHLLKAKSAIDTMCTHVTLWFDLLRTSGSLTEAQKAKVNKRLETISKSCVAEIDSLKGVMKSDIDKWNKSHPNHPFEMMHRNKSDVILGAIGEVLDWTDEIQ